MKKQNLKTESKKLQREQFSKHLIPKQKRKHIIGGQSAGDVIPELIVEDEGEL